MAHEYDTVERDLEHAGMTLSRHPSEAGVDWRLTLPRGEQIEAWERGTSGLSPPPEIGRRIERITAGRELVATPPRSEPRDVPSDEYGRFEDLARHRISERPRCHSKVRVVQAAADPARHGRDVALRGRALDGRVYVLEPQRRPVHAVDTVSSSF